MEKLKCFIIDDEQMSIDLLAEYVERTPALELIGASTSPADAIVGLRANSSALVFLDINMEEINGIEVTGLITNKVIFTTVDERYALQAFDIDNTIDYLLKPIQYARFLRSVDKAIERLSAPSTRISGPSITISTKTGKREILHTDISFVDSLKDYCKLHLSTGEVILNTEALKEIEGRLPRALFARVHKSYIVNLSEIASWKHNLVILRSGDTVPRGRAYKNQNI